MRCSRSRFWNASARPKDSGMLGSPASQMAERYAGHAADAAHGANHLCRVKATDSQHAMRKRTEFIPPTAHDHVLDLERC